MFKKLKERVTEEYQTAKFTIQGQASQYFDTLVNSSSGAAALSSSLQNNNDCATNELNNYSLVDLDDDDGDARDTTTMDTTTMETEKKENDDSLFTVPNPIIELYVPQSDIESECESDARAIDGVTREQLIELCVNLKNRGKKYKTRWSEVVNGYRSLVEERDKMRRVMVECQDKALRRINELKEQCLLEEKAKRHLEENLRIIIEEKDETIKVMKEKIDILNHETTDDKKVKHLESLLSRCKESLKTNKEKLNSIVKDNEQLRQYKESAQKEIETLRMTNDARALSMAECKRDLHDEFELKTSDFEQMKAQLESSAETVKNLESQFKSKTDLIEEMESKMSRIVQTADDEKENLIQELSRGKAAAIHLIREECERKIMAADENWKCQFEELRGEMTETQLEETKSQIEITRLQNQQLKEEMNQCQSKLNKTIEELNRVEENRQKEKHELEVMLNDAERRSKELLQQIDVLNERSEKLDQLKTDLDTSEDLLRDALMKTDDARNEMESLRNHLEEKNRIIDDINRKNTEMNCDTIAVMNNEIIVLKEKVEALERENHEIKDSRESIVQENAQIKESKEIVESKLNDKTTEIDDLRKAFDSIHAINNELTQKCETLTRECEEKSEREIRMNEQMEKLNTDLQQLSRSVEEKDCQLRNKEIELRQIESQLTTNCELQESESKLINEQLLHDNSRLKNLADDYENRAKQLEIRCESLSAELENAKIESKTEILAMVEANEKLLKCSDEKLMKTIEEHRDLYGSVVDECRELKVQFNVISEENETLKNQLNETNRKMEENEEQCKANERLKLEFEHLSVNCDEMKVKICENDSTIEQLKVQLKECGHEIDTFKGKFANELKRNEDLEICISESQREVQKLNDEIKCGNDSVIQLTDQLNARTTEASDLKEQLRLLNCEMQQLKDDDFEAKMEKSENERRMLLERVSVIDADLKQMSSIRDTLELSLKEQSMSSAAEIHKLNDQLTNAKTQYEETVERLYKQLEMRDAQLDETMMMTETRDSDTVRELTEIKCLNAKLNQQLEECREKCLQLENLNDQQPKNSDDTSLLQRIVILETQLNEKSGEFEEKIAKLEEKEDQLMCDHRKQLESLESELSEKNAALEEVHDYYHQRMAEKDVQLKALHDEFGSTTVNEHAYQVNAMQKSLLQYQEENVRLRELLDIRRRVESQNGVPLYGIHLPEPTEYEYLRNIIFEFMMGREPMTLAKVIAAVMRFSNDQTEQILRKQELASSSPSSSSLMQFKSTS